MDELLNLCAFCVLSFVAGAGSILFLSLVFSVTDKRTRILD